MKFTQLSIKFFLFATALTPLIISWSTIFPFILGKTIFFRILIEIALIFFTVYLFLSFETFKRLNFKNLYFFSFKSKNLIIIFLFLFLISFIFSVFFAENSYRAFWGDIERGEGLFGIFHFFAFLIMAVAMFDKKDWLNYFKISLVVGFIIIFYALLQYFEVRNFPFALMPEARPISYIGNSAFLATYMFFLMMFSVVVFFETPKQTFKLLNFETLKLYFWRYFSLLIIILSVLTIFISATRGAILGLGVGIFALLIYFSIFGSRTFIWKSDFLKLTLQKLAIGVILMMFIFSSAFWLTRDNQIWQKIPGLNRLAKTAVLDINDPSTQFRLITWKLSWNAFKEKPFFGWGPENYIVAYEKYYDPEYAIYGETWLDRAHNKVIDVAVMQGIFGLIAYLGIFASLFYLLIKKPLIDTDEKFTPILAALLLSYFVQNLVLFDTIISYFAFFAILGYLISIESCAENLQPPKHPPVGRATGQSYQLINLLIGLVLIFGFGYSLYFYNIAPYIQARLFKASSGVSRNVYEVVAALKRAMYPYNFAQFNIRSTGIDTAYLDQFFYNASYVSNPKFKPLRDLLIEGVDELARKEPYDIRVLIREVEMLNGITKVVDDESAKPFFQKAEKLMREAVKRAPIRQEVYYHLAFNLAGQKRYEESFEAARYAISLNPKVARAHFHLALMMAIADRNKEAAEIIENGVEKLDSRFDTLMSGDKNTVLLIYNLAGEKEKLAKIIIKSLNKEINFIFDRQYYEETLRYFAPQKDAENFIKVATYLSRFDDLKDDMEILIDLAQKELWDIIFKL